MLRLRRGLAGASSRWLRCLRCAFFLPGRVTAQSVAKSGKVWGKGDEGRGCGLVLRCCRNQGFSPLCPQLWPHRISRTFMKTCANLPFFQAIDCSLCCHVTGTVAFRTDKRMIARPFYHTSFASLHGRHLTTSKLGKLQHFHTPYNQPPHFSVGFCNRQASEAHFPQKTFKCLGGKKRMRMPTTFLRSTFSVIFHHFLDRHGTARAHMP